MTDEVLTATQSLVAYINAHYDGYIDSTNHEKSFNESMKASHRNSIKSGTVYLKVTGNGSVQFFVDKVTGDILKAASWNAPAKGVRGNVLSGINGLEAFNDTGIGLLQVRYLK
ncbi:MAG: hypothetical protein KGI54_14865 [Pseudomonadota bacterium]|nr:hypothetical protein [Pseudomonadota bacterium]